MSEQRRQGI